MHFNVAEFKVLGLCGVSRNARITVEHPSFCIETLISRYSSITRDPLVDIPQLKNCLNSRSSWNFTLVEQQYLYQSCASRELLLSFSINFSTRRPFTAFPQAPPHSRGASFKTFQLISLPDLRSFWYQTVHAAWTTTSCLLASAFINFLILPLRCPGTALHSQSFSVSATADCSCLQNISTRLPEAITMSEFEFRNGNQLQCFNFFKHWLSDYVMSLWVLDV